MMGGGAVDDDLSRPFGQGDRVRFDTLAIVEIPDRNLFTGNDIGQPHESGVYADAADVVDVGAGHHSMMNF
jgi:hypothetical protein